MGRITSYDQDGRIIADFDKSGYDLMSQGCEGEIERLKAENAKLRKKGITQAIRRMVSMSGKSGTDISRELGKTSGYLAVLLAEGRTPRTDLLAAIAKLCGYELILRGHGEEISLRPDTSGTIEVCE